jgi:hypothetical protein
MNVLGYVQQSLSAGGVPDKSGGDNSSSALTGLQSVMFD